MFDFFNVLNTSFVHIVLFATCWQSSLFFKYRKLNVLEGENNGGGGLNRKMYFTFTTTCSACKINISL